METWSSNKCCSKLDAECVYLALFFIDRTCQEQNNLVSFVHTSDVMRIYCVLLRGCHHYVAHHMDFSLVICIHQIVTIEKWGCTFVYDSIWLLFGYLQQHHVCLCESVDNNTIHTASGFARTPHTHTHYTDAYMCTFNNMMMAIISASNVRVFRLMAPQIELCFSSHLLLLQLD